MATPAPIPQTSSEGAPARLDNLRGIAWILTSAVAASLMSLAVREVSGTIDTRMIVALRSALITLAVLPGLLFVPALRRMRFTRPGQHLVRGALIAGATHLAFYTIAHVPLATAIVLFFTAPIFATLIAAVFQGERVGPRRIGAAVAGFAGAVIILRPETGLEPAMLAALGSSAMFAVALSMSRRLAQADGAAAAYVSSVVVTLLVSAPLAAPVFALPSGGWQWAVMAVVVVAGGLRGFADINAYRHAEAGLLAPFSYLRLVVTGVAAYFLFGEIPDRATILGATIIIGSTLYIARREAKLRKARLRTASAP